MRNRREMLKSAGKTAAGLAAGLITGSRLGRAAETVTLPSPMAKGRSSNIQASGRSCR